MTDIRSDMGERRLDNDAAIRQRAYHVQLSVDRLRQAAMFGYPQEVRALLADRQAARETTLAHQLASQELAQAPASGPAETAEPETTVDPRVRLPGVGAIDLAANQAAREQSEHEQRLSEIRAIVEREAA